MARSLENDAKMADARMQSLTTSLDQLKRQAANTNEQDVQLRALEREAKSQRDLLESYLAKYREASARDNVGAASPEARIISAAVVSNTPAYPKKLPTILVAALGMFVLSSGFILSGELLGAVSGEPVARPLPAAAPVSAPVAAPVAEPVVVPPHPVEAKVAAPGMAAPNLAGAAAAPPVAATQVAATQVAATSIAAEPAPAPARRASEARVPAGVPLEAVEGLARELGSAGATGRRITVLGTRRNVGTTLAAISLARRLAAQGKVALVDLALASPNLSAIASDPGAPGLSRSSRRRIVRPDHHARPVFARACHHGRQIERRR